MTINEAIKHCEEVAEKNESEANFGFGNACIDRSSCLECAKEHRQLATWLKELKAYKRFRLNKKEELDITVEIPDDAFFYYDRQLKYGMHNGDYTISVGTSSTHIRKTFEVRIRNGSILKDE